MGNPAHLVVSLTGHSGGGSFMFGFIEGQDAIPSWLERIAFLDAVYNFDSRTHGSKLSRWLQQDSTHTLVSIAYDDRNIMLDGKKVVSDSGGTWRASARMVADLQSRMSIVHDTLGEFGRYRARQVEILVHPNPGNRILHTEMIGEMNAYMHAMLVRRAVYSGSLLKPSRAYMQWTDGEVVLPSR
jgi:hypothetical protein